MELLKTAVKQPLIINQLQFSVTEAGMVTSGNPFQYGFFKGTFLDNDEFPELNEKLAEIGEKHGLTKTGVAAAQVIRLRDNSLNCQNVKSLRKISSMIESFREVIKYGKF